MALTSPIAIQTLLDNHPMIQGLRATGDYVEYRAYQDYPRDLREQNLTAGPLTGPQMIPIPPYVFAQRGGESLIEILYLGKHVSGYYGIVHGGLLATMIDEALGWCCFPSLPGGVGATATLSIEYLAPMPTESIAVLKAQTKSVVGRKAWVEGHMETLVENGEPVIIAKARALFVSPRNIKLGI
ncbi:thioesterase family protein [Penicillium nucicola]|uniref:thioesterase family protein n=1 Tax=Penicillium nucicola TaxID=1850975 RepID=UPI0025451A94|nr:thioesterase family protein [Penicillium nucicola]KAJ5749383.1 thioesterase family protein [Penicillium nucicola]